jgi:tRNA 2-thiocytidine biosynthesis protein TtcA
MTGFETRKQIMTALERHLRKWMEKAVLDFSLIGPDDGVAVGVSGGKDSLTLLHLLQGPMVHVARTFRLVAVHVDAGIPGSDPESIERHFRELGVDFEIVPAAHEFKDILDPEAAGRPCFACSRRRRRLLFEAAKRHNCTRVALAHHRDDAVETFLMNQFFNREVSTMLPDQPLFDGAMHIIRPLYYIRERLVTRFAAQAALPVVKTLCPAEDHTRRLFVKNVLKEMESQDPYAHDNLFRAMFRVRDNYLPKLEGKLELP